jgi:hypothetical protein
MTHGGFGVVEEYDIERKICGTRLNRALTSTSKKSSQLFQRKIPVRAEQFPCYFPVRFARRKRGTAEISALGRLRQVLERTGSLKNTLLAGIWCGDWRDQHCLASQAHPFARGRAPTLSRLPMTRPCSRRRHAAVVHLRFRFIPRRILPDCACMVGGG